MKSIKILLASVMISGSAFISSLSAQKVWSVGLEAGPAFSIYGGDAVDPAHRTRFAGGLNLTYSRTNNASLTMKALYIQKGGGYRTLNGRAEDRLDYLEIPVIARFYFNREGRFRPNLFLGPSLGILVDSESGLISGSRRKTIYRTDFNTVDVGANLGIGLNYRVGETLRILLDAWFNHGLINVYSKGPDKYYNQSLGITAGLSIGL